jgi:pre-mRNA branch site protein p14
MSSSSAARRRNMRLPPEVNRALHVRNLPYSITAEDMYDIFGKYGAIRQIRLGNEKSTKGTAFVVYEDVYDAKNAVDHLSGFNVAGRYLVVLYYSKTKMQARSHAAKEKEELEKLKKQYAQMVEGKDNGDKDEDGGGDDDDEEDSASA